MPIPKSRKLAGKKASKEKAEASKPNSCVATFLPTFYRGLVADSQNRNGDDDVENGEDGVDNGVEDGEDDVCRGFSFLLAIVAYLIFVTKTCPGFKICDDD